MKVRDIYDIEGNTEQEVMTQDEITQIVSDFDETGEMMDLLTTEGLFQEGQSFGDRCELEIDTRNGEISAHTAVQNSLRFSELFFIQLVKIPKHILEDHEVCEGADMSALVSSDFLIKTLDFIDDTDDIDIFLEYEKVGDLYKIDWHKNPEITAEDFVTHFLKESWGEWVDNYTDFLFEDIEINYESIENYYKGDSGQ